LVLNMWITTVWDEGWVGMQWDKNIFIHYIHMDEEKP